MRASLDSPTRLVIHLAPDLPGFHLYSVTMPSGGVGGIGIPTRAVVGGGLVRTGPVRADVVPHGLRIAELGVTLPVYPNGPVTLTVPVRRTSTADPRLSVSYGACSVSRCLIPVQELSVPVGNG